VAHLYVIRSAARERLRADLAAQGIATEIHYPVPDHLQQASRETPGSLPETERAAREILTLPCYPELRDGELERIAQSLRVLARAGRVA
jgi:dTDP-4-amino-4,6-dideoxygalactose transaminase